MTVPTTGKPDPFGGGYSAVGMMVINADPSVVPVQ